MLVFNGKPCKVTIIPLRVSSSSAPVLIHSQLLSWLLLCGSSCVDPHPCSGETTPGYLGLRRRALAGSRACLSRRTLDRRGRWAQVEMSCPRSPRCDKDAGMPAAASSERTPGGSQMRRGGQGGIDVGAGAIKVSSASMAARSGVGGNREGEGRRGAPCRAPPAVLRRGPPPCRAPPAARPRGERRLLAQREGQPLGPAEAKRGGDGDGGWEASGSCRLSWDGRR